MRKFMRFDIFLDGKHLNVQQQTKGDWTLIEEIGILEKLKNKAIKEIGKETQIKKLK